MRERLVNSYHPDRPLPGFGVTVHFDDPSVTDEAILAELRVTVLALVDHEAHEFFKLDGKPLIDPHAEHDTTKMSYYPRSRLIRERETKDGPRMPRVMIDTATRAEVRDRAWRGTHGAMFVADEAFKFDLGSDFEKTLRLLCAKLDTSNLGDIV